MVFNVDGNIIFVLKKEDALRTISKVKTQQVCCCFFLVMDVVVPLCSLLCASRLHAMCVLLSIQAVNEQSKREAKKRRRRERAFLHANATNKVRLACIF
jgi:hypothetical protein